MGEKKRRDQIAKQKRGPQGAPPPVPDLDYIEDRADQPEPPKIELFKYKGESYYMVEPDATMMLRLIKAAGERGEMGAVYVMLSGLMGEETYNLLMGIPNFTKQELKSVIDRVMHYSMDVMDEIMGE